MLFVALTFAGFFLFELVKRIRVHPVQYLLVGLALALFFLLLVALSEHVAFGWAYLAASVACIGLLGFYLSFVLRSIARGAGFAATLAMLYAALYGLLVSEDNALVLGAGLLFAILAAIMVATRKIDWYAPMSGGSSFAPSSSTAFALTVEVNPPTTYPATPMPLISTTASATPISLSSCPTALGERS